MDVFINYYTKVSQPKIAFIYAIRFLFLWFALGIADEFIFKKYDYSCYDLIPADIFLPPQQVGQAKTIPWIKDILGHWATTFAVIAIILTRFWNIHLTAESSKSISRLSDIIFKRELLGWGHLILVTCLILGFVNGAYVSSHSEEVHWQAQTCNVVLPYSIGILFYVGVLFPVLMCYLRVLTKLRVLCNHCTKTVSFNQADPKGMYGIESIGSLINAFLSISLLCSFPMLVFQWHFKTGDISLGNVVGFLFLFFIIYHSVLSPLLLLNKNLQEVRQSFLRNTSNEWNKLQQQISKVKINTENEAEVNLLELKRMVIVQKLALSKKMKLVPLAIKSQVLTVFSAIPSTVTVIAKVIEVVG